jgi:hypothetical protein
MTVPQQVVIVDPSVTGRRAEVDAATHALVVITHAHHEIHEGDTYTISQVTALDALDTGSPLTYYVVTPDTTDWVHLWFQAELSEGGYMEVFEDTGVAAEFDVSGGTAQTPINMNRNSSNTSGLTITYGATVTAATSAARLDAKVVGGKKSAGATAARHEFILKQNTEYLFRVSTYADNNEGSLGLGWYEHTDKTSG